MLLYGIFGAFFALMIAIGVLFSKHDSNSEVYYLGGRQLGPVVIAMSMVASDMSGWLLLGIPGLVFTHGISSAWIVVGVVLGAFCSWLCVGEHIRKRSAELKAITVPEYLSKIVDDRTGRFRILAAFITLIFLIFYTSAGLVTAAKLFEQTLQLDYHWGLLVGASCVALYTSLGGFFAVAITDVIQVILVVAPMVVIPSFLIAKGTSIHVSIEQLDLFTNLSGGSISWVTILSMIFWGLGYLGQPHLLVRFKAAKNTLTLNRARNIATAMNIVCVVASVSIGLLGFAYCQNQKVLVSDPERIFLILANLLFNPAISGCVAIAVLAAVMSSADSQLLICASCVSEDFLPKNRSGITIGRLSIVATTLIAIVLGWNPNSSVLELVSYAWGGFGASFGPIILISRFQKVSIQAAYIGMLTGFFTVVVWGVWGLEEVYGILPGFALSFVAILVSKLFVGSFQSRNIS